MEDKEALPEAQRLIDIDKVLFNKNPKLAKIIPKFLVRLLKRIVHEDELNDFLYRNRDMSGLNFVNAALNEFGVITNVEGRENLPANGRFIIVSNHPLGGLDGLALMSEVGKVRPDLLFPVNDLLMNVPNLRDLFIPINKHGSNMDNFKIFEDSFASNAAILYFPAGLCSRKQRRIIRDLEWQKSFISLAKKYNRDIIPVFIGGQNSQFFYNLANLRKKLKIRAYIEMLFLVDEMYKQRDKKLRLVFGKPIAYSLFNKDLSDWEWAGRVKQHVYDLSREGAVTFSAKP